MINIITWIDRFALVLAPIFYKLLYISIAASFIGASIIIIRRLFEIKISPKWISIFWIVFIITLINPVKIESRFSIYNYILTGDVILNGELEKSPNGLYRDDYNIAKSEYERYEKSDISEENKEMELKNEVTKRYIQTLIADTIIPYMWLIYMITLLITYIASYKSFVKKVRQSKELDNRLLNILEKCKKELNIKRNIEIVIQKHMKTPSIFGVFKIKILLNEDIGKMSDDEIRYVFMHELGHYKRKDNIVNMIIVGIKIIYCFNPIIWVLCGQMRKDMEPATDAIAIKNLNTKEQKGYCKTLVMLSCLGSQQGMIRVLCLSNNKKNLERRITTIKLYKTFKRNKMEIRILAISMIIFITSIFYTSKITNNVVEGNEECLNNTDCACYINKYEEVS